MESTLALLAISIIPVLFAITVHEAMHGYAARHFGDDTAWRMGRISLNPLRHIDPVGTVVVPLVLYWGSGGAFAFGWAKPVPVNFNRLRHPKQDMLWVAAAGPGSNFVMALFWALLLKLAVSGVIPDLGYASALKEMARIGVSVNGMLMILNLLPIPPLDGGRIAVSLLPLQLARSYARLEPYGMLIMVLLMVTHVLDVLLLPLLRIFAALVFTLFGF